jgi:hypothetical protein
MAHVARLPELHSLNVSGCCQRTLTDVTFCALSAARVPLTELDMSGCLAATDAAFAALALLPTLRALRMRKCVQPSVTERSIVALLAHTAAPRAAALRVLGDEKLPLSVARLLSTTEPSDEFASTAAAAAAERCTLSFLDITSAHQLSLSACFYARDSRSLRTLLFSTFRRDTNPLFFPMKFLAENSLGMALAHEPSREHGANVECFRYAQTLEQNKAGTPHSYPRAVW